MNENSFKRINSSKPNRMHVIKGEASNLRVFPYADLLIIFLTGDNMGSVISVTNCFSLFSFGITTRENKKRSKTKPPTTLKNIMTAVPKTGFKSIKLRHNGVCVNIIMQVSCRGTRRWSNQALSKSSKAFVTFYFAQGNAPLLCRSSFVSPRISTLFGAARNIPDETF